jgi:hypothetical protein
MARPCRRFRCLAALALATVLCLPQAQARPLYRCERDGTTSWATAPEPGSRCVMYSVDDNSNLMRGIVYQRMQDGRTVYSTRNLPGSLPTNAYVSTTLPELSMPPPVLEVVPPHLGLGRIGSPRTREHAAYFKAAARENGLEDAWLRAIAHAESGFRADAVSPKGAMGVMQLMPATAKDYKVRDPFSPKESIGAGARYLRALLRRFKGDRTLAAAAYNAGTGAVSKYRGVPPYRETVEYVAKVDALFELYSHALDDKRRGREAK